jgi:membrane-bound lytic murein transglycosylase C
MQKYILFLVPALLLAQTFKAFEAQQQNFQQQEQQFEQYKQARLQSFENYKKAQQKAFQDYKEALGKYWSDPKLSTRKQWLSYTADKRTRSDVDFQKQTITIQTIAKSKTQATKALKAALARAVTINNVQVQKTDPLQKRLDAIKRPIGVVNSGVTNDPILATVVFNKKPTREMVTSYVNTHVKNDITGMPSPKVKNEYIYTVSIKLPSDTMQKRSKIYYQKVTKYAKEQRVSPALVFAVIQTESSFNPRARSYVPAYGLMQIVPSTAGRDAYYFLYNKQRLVSGTYLYNSANNIRLGSAYLHLLYYKYFKSIKNPTSRLYCTIAAYNTGAGNVAWVFNKKRNISASNKLLVSYADDTINTMTPQEVYRSLVTDLRYGETRLYIQKVSKRMLTYNKLYNF